MRRWGARQNGVGFNQRGSCNDHLGSSGEPPFDFSGSSLMMFMP